MAMMFCICVGNRINPHVEHTRIAADMDEIQGHTADKASIVAADSGSDDDDDEDVGDEADDDDTHVQIPAIMFSESDAPSSNGDTSNGGIISSSSSADAPAASGSGSGSCPASRPFGMLLLLRMLLLLLLLFAAGPEK
jgi:hypothetical protein